MITNILAYIDGRSSAENAAAAAFLLATRHNAHVEGLFVRTDVSDVIPNAPIYAIDGALPLVEQYVKSSDRETAQTEQRAKEAFAQTRDQFAFAEGDATSSTVHSTANWTVVTGSPENTVSHRARISDLCVIGRSSNLKKNSTTSVINEVLLNSGRPVLVVPPEPLTSAGGDIVVAWNCSADSARALNTAMPLFEKADRLRLVYVDTGVKKGPSAEEAATYLARHGFKSEVEIITPYDRSVGAALVRYAQDADLLVLGAYSLSYVCGAVLGRVTRHVRAHAQTPVLIV